MKLVYFSWVREMVGRDEEEVELPDEIDTVAKFFIWLAARGEEFEALMQQPGVIRVALDKQHVSEEYAPLSGVSEIALFPPMTGG